MRRTQTKTLTGNEQTRAQSRFFQGETLTLDSCRSFDYARGNESIIFFTDLCKPIKRYIYARKKHLFASYPAAKQPKRSKFVVTDIREKPVNFFYGLTPASTLVSAIILLTQVPVQKFPFLFISTIPWFNAQLKGVIFSSLLSRLFPKNQICQFLYADMLQLTLLLELMLMHFKQLLFFYKV